jgi:hypothetical protein
MPFDGVSVVRLINHAGISLVLSSLTPLEIAPIHFFERRPDGSLKRRMPTGKVIDEVIGSLVQEDYVCVVASRERLFSHHLCSLLRTLQDFPEAGCAWSDALAPQLNDIDQPALCDDPEVRNLAGQTIGFGRYLFRMSAIEERIHHALPYLDSLAVHLLFGTSKSVPTRRCMLIAAETERVGELDNGMSIDLEREILIDISPKVFATIAHERIEQTRLPQPLEPALPPQPAALSLLGMTPEERRNSRSSWRTAFRFPLL